MAIRRGCLAAILVAGTLAFAGCGSKSSTASTPSTASTTSTTSVGHLPTAKFVLHAGLALGALHRYIYKPFKAGSFTGGSLFKHKLAIAKAGLAGLFAYHELKLAVADAKASPILSKLLAPVDALGAKLAALGSSLKGGHIDSGAITSVNAEATNLAGAAQASGLPLAEKVPGAAELAGV